MDRRSQRRTGLCRRHVVRAAVCCPKLPPTSAIICAVHLQGTPLVFAALVWGARKAGVASDRLAVTELTREDLGDQHVCGLNADADDPRHKTDHRVWAFLAIAVRFEPLQACFLNRSNLLTHDV